MRDIISGVVLIGIGFVIGGSVFLGNLDPLNFVFDGLGTFLIIKGGIAVYQEKQRG